MDAQPDLGVPSPCQADLLESGEPLADADNDSVRKLWTRWRDGAV